MKVLYAARIVRLGFNVVVTEPDTYWNKNALEFVTDVADVGITADQPSLPGCPVMTPIKFGDEPAACVPGQAGWSSGFYFVRATPGGVRYIMALLRGIQDNFSFEQAVLSHYVPIQPEVRNEVTFVHLSEAKFVPGSVVMKPVCPSKEVYYVGHANWAIGIRRKRQKLQDCDMWLL
eukprot:TRINITY_DN10866_c0_g1_i2.p1 TRINITY_DN10866_c0_g1~~TRINITY_DN10866_c0_g1_i2.p1  ORF type:complete len:176 (+),score=29.77 TRINITY_DN10866_c0_g1_i2:397-924(+)